MMQHRISPPAELQLLLCAVCIFMFVPGSSAWAGERWDPDLHEQLVHRYYRSINEGELDTADDILTANFLMHDNGEPPEAAGPEVLRQLIQECQENNSVYGILIEDMLFAEDKVVVRWKWQSTNTQWGSPKEVVSSGISVFRFAEERIAELWRAYDVLKVQEQLGFTMKAPE